MLRFQLSSDCQPRTKNGQPPHSTTGVASRNSTHCSVCMDRRSGNRPGAMSASMARINTGKASRVEPQKRRLMSMSSAFFSSTTMLRGSSAMPHFGQLPGVSCTISGCMGQVYSVRVTGACRVSGSSAMPQPGQAPGPCCRTSGHIGQMCARSSLAAVAGGGLR